MTSDGGGVISPSSTARTNSSALSSSSNIWISSSLGSSESQVPLELGNSISGSYHLIPGFPHFENEWGLICATSSSRWPTSLLSMRIDGMKEGIIEARLATTSNEVGSHSTEGQVSVTF